MEEDPEDKINESKPQCYRAILKSFLWEYASFVKLSAMLDTVIGRYAYSMKRIRKDYL